MSKTVSSLFGFNPLWHPNWSDSKNEIQKVLLMSNPATSTTYAWTYTSVFIFEYFPLPHTCFWSYPQGASTRIILVFQVQIKISSKKFQFYLIKSYIHTVLRLRDSKISPTRRKNSIFFPVPAEYFALKCSCISSYYVYGKFQNVR